MEKNMHKELKINLQDIEWKYDYIDHDRNIARALFTMKTDIFIL